MNDLTKLETFWKWYADEAKKRRLTTNAIEKNARLGTGTIYKRMNANLAPSVAICKAIGKAFDMNPTEIMLKAGVVPPNPRQLAEVDPTMKRLLEVAANLTPQEREEGLNYLLFIRARDK